MTHHNDMLIVGAGILGLSHAYAAARRGLKVTLFERSETPLGASVRNFGQALVTGQPPGPMLELAKSSRDIWSQWAQLAGLQLKRNGSYLFARTEAEERLGIPILPDHLRPATKREIILRMIRNLQNAAPQSEALQYERLVQALEN